MDCFSLDSAWGVSCDSAEYRCEVCEQRSRGDDLCYGYPEAHHVAPLKALGDKTQTRPRDLCVCANCHRMLHHMSISKGRRRDG
jgi:predicted HNH restriction endonuclease